VLTADLVTARRRGSELRLVPLGEAARARVEDLAQTYLGIARASVGQSRDDLETSWDAVPVAAHEQRLAGGVRKLIADRCVWSASSADAPDLRRQLFTAAHAARRALPAGTPFDREAILRDVAARRDSGDADVEAQLYADLHGAERLRDVGAVSPPRLAADFDLAQAQGILLRAVRVIAEVRAADPAVVRALFRKLKFLRLLHNIVTTARGRYRIEIDGPFSLFQSVTRYGLQLALALPAIASCDAWRIEAEVMWGQQRQPVRFLLSSGPWEGPESPAMSSGRRSRPSLTRSTSESSMGSKPPAMSLEGLPDEVAALLRDVNRSDGVWRAQVASDVLDLPGVGLCVPDLVFEHRETGQRVFLEVLGFWSRDAVWRRVDLVRAGLPHPILFAVSKQLRVSEAALGDDLPGALYVYSRVMSARAVLSRVDQLVARVA
jgi:predicted nuclease of restriction endonuclease-like RecB superfamily